MAQKRQQGMAMAQWLNISNLNMMSEERAICLLDIRTVDDVRRVGRRTTEGTLVYVRTIRTTSIRSILHQSTHPSIHLQQR